MSIHVNQDDDKAWGRTNNMRQPPMNDQESKGEWDTKAEEGGRGQIARLLEGLVGGDEDWDFKHNWRMLSQAGYPGGEDASGEGRGGMMAGLFGAGGEGHRCAERISGSCKWVGCKE